LGTNNENDMFVGDFHNGYLYHFDLSNDRKELSLKEPLNNKIANNPTELERVIFAKDLAELQTQILGLMTICIFLQHFLVLQIVIQISK
jgi:hypothetical protein